ncbi:MAG: retroviral-like aspartic protease family protein [Chloroflexota bacterium]
MHQAETMQAKLDTGAARTMIPALSARRLGLIMAGLDRLRAFDGRVVDVKIYLVDLAIVGVTFEAVEVGTIDRDYILLGRDLLNQFDITLRGAIACAGV